jgi:hypothetical protein
MIMMMIDDDCTFDVDEMFPSPCPLRPLLLLDGVITGDLGLLRAPIGGLVVADLP